MNILISGKLTGLGNNLAWIPAIKELLRNGENVYCDNMVLYELSGSRILGIGKIKPDIVYVVYPHRRAKFWKLRKKYPFAKFYGFKYHIGHNVYGYGYTKALEYDQTIHEVENVNKLIPNKQKFELNRMIDDSVPKRIRIGLIGTDRYLKRYDYWHILIDQIKQSFPNYEIKLYGDLKVHQHWISNYISTPTISGFRSELEKCSMIVCYEGFGMHLADLLRIPMVVLWGYGNYIKNRPIHEHRVVFGYDIVPKDIIDEIKKLEVHKTEGLQKEKILRVNDDNY